MIKNIKLNNFRNISKLELDLDPKLNIFYGNNAQGKTNIVEAINYLSLLKSFRNVEHENLIKDGCEFATIEVINDKNDIYKVIINKDKRTLFINNNKVLKRNNFIGQLISITFTPENVNMFKDSPKIRRDFLDDILSMVYPSYSTYLNNYEKYRINRNNCLKETNINLDLIDTYNNLLANYGKVLINKRNEFVNYIKNIINNYYQKLSDSNDTLEIDYVSDFLNMDESSINKRLKDTYQEDLSKGITLLGPHRDDLVMKLNNKDIKTFGSQGQNRLSVISLKLSLLEFIKEKTNIDSMVILDDVLSELDYVKQEKLLSCLNIKNQIFITTTKNVEVKNGLCVEIKNGNKGGNING